MKQAFMLAVVVVVAVAGCTSPAAEDPVQEPTDGQIEWAESAADDLVAELSSRLIAELQESGPLGAIDVCSKVAQQIAREHSGDGLLIRRVGLRVRNPVNQASAWARRQLERWERDMDRGKTPMSIAANVEGSGPDGARSREYWYLRPLLVGPPCLNCHGDLDEMDPAVVERLAELYPSDEAVGYALGDLRGAVFVRLGLDGQQQLPVLGPGVMQYERVAPASEE
jgi:hypothetical protein